MNRQKVKLHPTLKLLETIIIIGAILIGSKIVYKTGFIGEEHFLKIGTIGVGILLGLVIAAAVLTFFSED